MNIIKPPQAAVELMQKARALLVLDHPFFASIVLRKPIHWTDSMPTACVTAKGDIYINPAFIAPLTASHVIFLLAHECLHYMLLHGSRRGHRDMSAWNIACDQVINETLVESRVGTFIDGGQRHPGADKMRAEDLYQDQPEGGGAGPGGIGSDIMDEPMTEGEATEVEAQVRIDATQAKQAAKMQGKLPAALARLVDSIIDVRTPWHQILERFMESFRRDDLSWSRPNRRHIADNIYLPGTNYIPEMGEVVIGMDTSGSIGAAELAHFGGHINRIMEQCRPTAIHVVYCDARVNRTDTFTCEDLPVKLEAVGGGGTEFSPVFDWVAERGIEPDVLVYLTDGYGPFPESPEYPVVWLMTSDVVAPFGESVKYELAEV